MVMPMVPLALPIVKLVPLGEPRTDLILVTMMGMHSEWHNKDKAAYPRHQEEKDTPHKIENYK